MIGVFFLALAGAQNEVERCGQAGSGKQREGGGRNLAGASGIGLAADGCACAGTRAADLRTADVGQRHRAVRYGFGRLSCGGRFGGCIGFCWAFGVGRTERQGGVEGRMALGASVQANARPGTASVPLAVAGACRA